MHQPEKRRNGFVILSFCDPFHKDIWFSFCLFPSSSTRYWSDLGKFPESSNLETFVGKLIYFYPIYIYILLCFTIFLCHFKLATMYHIYKLHWHISEELLLVKFVILKWLPYGIRFAVCSGSFITKCKNPALNFI
jgi:hypothetical protein